MLVARGKIEKRIALLSIEEMRKRLNEFVTRTEKVKTESMDYMETGLLQIALLDHQTKGVTQDLMKARKGNLQSLEQKAERLHDVLTKQKQEAARTQEILNGYNNRKIVLG